MRKSFCKYGLASYLDNHCGENLSVSNPVCTCIGILESAKYDINEEPDTQGIWPLVDMKSRNHHKYWWKTVVCQACMGGKP